MYTYFVHQFFTRVTCSKGKLWNISQICELNRYQTISSQICSWRCVVLCIKMLKFNSCGKSRKYPTQVWVPMTVEGYMYFCVFSSQDVFSRSSGSVSWACGLVLYTTWLEWLFRMFTTTTTCMQMGFYHLETIYISPCYSRPNYIEYGCLNVIECLCMGGQCFLRHLG